jgi:hypothetical protein
VTLARLSINQQTGEISGDGPGEVRSTHFSNQETSLTGAAVDTKPRAVAPPPGVRGAKLHFLRIEFQHALSGNLNKRELRFLGRVRTVYGPVDAWEQELDGTRREALPPESMTLSCDDLAINEDPQAALMANNPNQSGQRPLGPVQMRASGNVRIDGQSQTERFGAQADSASYDKAKDVFVLEGNTRTPAMLWRRKGPDDNSSPQYATWIRYDRKTGDTAGRFTSLEFTPEQLPQTPGRPASGIGNQLPQGPVGQAPRPDRR